MALNVLEAVRARGARGARSSPSPRGEVYGPPATLPVDEDAPLRPQNPYAVSKAAADLLAGFYADAHGLRVDPRRARSTTPGPGQAPIYAIASFARQVAAAARGAATTRSASSPATRTRGATTPTCATSCAPTGCWPSAAEPGVYNVCSGARRRPRELVALLAEAAGAEIDHVVDPALVRAHEVMEVRGAQARLTAATGWEPESRSRHAGRHGRVVARAAARGLVGDRRLPRELMAA